MDWSKARSMVAGPNGLDVTFEDDNGQLGATRLPYASQRSPVRQTPWNTEFQATFPCTDSEMKTYRPVYPGGTLLPAPLFKSCSDNSAWVLLTGNFTYEFPGKLQRLDAKPGYIAVWVDVPFPFKAPQQY